MSYPDPQNQYPYQAQQPYTPQQQTPQPQQQQQHSPYGGAPQRNSSSINWDLSLILTVVGGGVVALIALITLVYRFINASDLAFWYDSFDVVFLFWNSSTLRLLVVGVAFPIAAIALILRSRSTAGNPDSEQKKILGFTVEQIAYVLIFVVALDAALLLLGFGSFFMGWAEALLALFQILGAAALVVGTIGLMRGPQPAPSAAPQTQQPQAQAQQPQGFGTQQSPYGQSFGYGQPEAYPGEQQQQNPWGQPQAFGQQPVETEQPAEPEQDDKEQQIPYGQFQDSQDTATGQDDHQQQPAPEASAEQAEEPQPDQQSQNQWGSFQGYGQQQPYAQQQNPYAPQQAEQPADAEQPAETEEHTEAQQEPVGGSTAAGYTPESTEQAEPQQQTQHQPFWFAVNWSRITQTEAGQPAFELQPGRWILALEDRGSEFLVRNDNGETAILRDLEGIERAPQQ